jgi:hypothetical protein
MSTFKTALRSLPDGGSRLQTHTMFPAGPRSPPSKWNLISYGFCEDCFHNGDDMILKGFLFIRQTSEHQPVVNSGRKKLRDCNVTSYSDFKHQPVSAFGLAKRWCDVQHLLDSDTVRVRELSGLQVSEVAPLT